jgi:hypothetical protein
MRRQPARDPSAVRQVADAVQLLVHRDRFAHVVVDPTGVAYAEHVALALIIAPEAEEKHLQPLAREARVARDVAAQHGAHRKADSGQLSAGDLLHAVPGGNVADLVAEHRRHLGFGGEMGQDAARHVHGAARQREGVDHGVVHHPEAPGQVGALRYGRQGEADPLHVSLELGIVHQGHRSFHLLRELLSHLDLLGLAHEREHLSARGWVGRTGDHEEGQHQRAGETRSENSVGHSPILQSAESSSAKMRRCRAS